MESEPSSRAYRALVRYMPNIEMPDTSNKPMNLTVLGLFLACFTLTYPRSRLAAFSRIVIFFPTAYYGLDVAFGDHVPPVRPLSAGLSLLGVLGVMRAVDICLVSLLDDEPPHWLQNGKKVPLPTTLWGRLLYAFDMVSTTRGTSWFAGSGYCFDWAPKRVLTYHSPYSSRFQWIAHTIAWLILFYIFQDLSDTLNHLRDWDTSLADPVTSLPIAWQLVYSVSVAFGTYSSIFVPSNVWGVVSGLLGAAPEVWPPMLDAPFSATSLQDFWTNRWHHIFRRVFHRLTWPVLLLLPKNTSPGVRRIVRAVLVFGLSASYHLILIQRMLSRPWPGSVPILPSTSPAFLNPDILKFFLLQPLGLLIERFVIFPLLHSLPLERRTRKGLGRTWTWAWFLWTGRYWADAWVRGGCWGPDEGHVGWSPIRGVLWGEWWTI